MASNPNNYKYIEINGQRHLVTVLPVVNDNSPSYYTAQAKHLTFRRAVRELEEEREAGFLSYRTADSKLRIF